jgi:hypothetical protein
MDVNGQLHSGCVVPSCPGDCQPWGCCKCGDVEGMIIMPLPQFEPYSTCLQSFILIMYTYTLLAGSCEHGNELLCSTILGNSVPS